jgi:hypothetical protein
VRNYPSSIYVRPLFYKIDSENLSSFNGLNTCQGFSRKKCNYGAINVVQVKFQLIEDGAWSGAGVGVGDADDTLSVPPL